MLAAAIGCKHEKFHLQSSEKKVEPRSTMGEKRRSAPLEQP